MTVGYLIDTDRVIDHFNGIRSVTERLQQLRSAGLAISIVSLAELYEGIHYSLEPTRTRPSCSGNRLHALEGDRAGHHAIRVNDQYRVIFRFEGQDAHDVCCTDSR